MIHVPSEGLLSFWYDGISEVETVFGTWRPGHELTLEFYEGHPLRLGGPYVPSLLVVLHANLDTLSDELAGSPEFADWYAKAVAYQRSQETS